jgi:bifunctional DNA-binding transcriptional regulator/antitoxin component of YhaV-PrlF toxin-antitoxin module
MLLEDTVKVVRVGKDSRSVIIPSDVAEKVGIAVGDKMAVYTDAAYPNRIVYEVQR